jgi:hypothetical protein
MEKEFIPYEQALALKELGFDEKCLSYPVSNTDASGRTWTSVLVAPLYQQAFRWFRKEYGYFQLFDYQHGDSKINKGFFFNIININDNDFFFPEDFENKIYKIYEEAELECLKKLIEIVKNK